MTRAGRCAEAGAPPWAATSAPADLRNAWLRPADLVHALAHEQFVLHYQPQMHLPTGQVAGLEALVRWRHPQRGLVAPDHFIPLAEQTDLIRPLSRWVLTTALRQSQRWRQARPETRIAVNCSMQTLQDPHWAQTVLTLCDAWQVSPTRLTVEITESTRASNLAQVHTTLTCLRRHGVWIALDDVGAGYASLAALHRLPVDACKLDKPFIFALRTDAKAAAIVRMLIALGHTLGLQVVAEGVENRDTYDLLTTLGCDVVQGFYVSRPLAAADVLPWLHGACGQFRPGPLFRTEGTPAPYL